METEKLIAALRYCDAVVNDTVNTGSCNFCPYRDHCSDLDNEAADLIESLQAQLSAKEAINQAYSATVSLLETDKAELVEQLSVSQAREQAAVELIGKVSQAVEVAFNATDYVKPNTGIWHTLGLALDWIKAWRGPQKAGEEKQNEPTR